MADSTRIPGRLLGEANMTTTKHKASDTELCWRCETPMIANTTDAKGNLMCPNCSAVAYIVEGEVYTPEQMSKRQVVEGLAGYGGTGPNVVELDAEIYFFPELFTAEPLATKYEFRVIMTPPIISEKSRWRFLGLSGKNDNAWPSDLNPRQHMYNPGMQKVSKQGVVVGERFRMAIRDAILKVLASNEVENLTRRLEASRNGKKKESGYINPKVQARLELRRNHVLEFGIAATDVIQLERGLMAALTWEPHLHDKKHWRLKTNGHGDS